MLEILAARTRKGHSHLMKKVKVHWPSFCAGFGALLLLMIFFALGAAAYRVENTGVCRYHQHAVVNPGGPIMYPQSYQKPYSSSGGAAAPSQAPSQITQTPPSQLR